jgi:hypothetical protein
MPHSVTPRPSPSMAMVPPLPPSPGLPPVPDDEVVAQVAERAAVAAGVVDEGAAGDGRRAAAEGEDGAAGGVLARDVADVVGEHAVDDVEAAAGAMDGSATAIEVRALRAAMGETKPLHGDARRVALERRREFHEPRGVATVEGDEAAVAAVEDEVGIVEADDDGRRQRHRHRFVAAVEAQQRRRGERRPQRVFRAGGRRAVANDGGGRRVDEREGRWKHEGRWRWWRRWRIVCDDVTGRERGEREEQAGAHVRL